MAFHEAEKEKGTSRRWVDRMASVPEESIEAVLVIGTKIVPMAAGEEQTVGCLSMETPLQCIPPLSPPRSG